MRARGLLETALYTDDLPALERFYVEVIGLERIAATAGRNCVLRCGAAALILFDRSASAGAGGAFPPHGSVGGGHIAFAVADAAELQRWREHLSRHGVEVEREVAWPDGDVSVYFRDPAGNSVELAPSTLWGGLGRELLGSAPA